MKDGIAWLCVKGKEGESWERLIISDTAEEDSLLPDERRETKVGFMPFALDKKELLGKRYGHQN